MNGRPHESLDCHCQPCAAFDYEQDVMHSFGYAWSDSGWTSAAYAAERAAWESLILVCDAVFADDGIKTK